MTDDQFWHKESTAKWWQECDLYYDNERSETYLRAEVDKYDFQAILEVGSGTGRLIGQLPGKRAALDVNASLLDLVAQKYPDVATYKGSVEDMGFDEGQYDLVFTYQVLQHLPNIDQALSEIKRVAKQEYWLMEGFMQGKGNHDMTHPFGSGSYIHYIDQMVDCYEVHYLSEDKVMVYKVKA